MDGTRSVLSPPPAPRRRRGVPALLDGARRAWHRLHTTLRPPEIRLVYSPEYERAMPGGVPFDPLRADRVLAFLANEGLIRRDEIEVARPASLTNLLAVHTSEYIAALQRRETLTQILGGPVSEDELESVLDYQRLMTGGTIWATRCALSGGNVAVNMGGGFHHAEPSRGMGFCIFNDIAVAIVRLRRRGFSLPVLVIDLDLHDGNGTRVAFATDPTVYTFSIHNDHWGPTEAIASTSIALGAGVTDGVLLETLERELPAVLDSFRPRLVVYLAGCDVAADDQIGNWRMSARGILNRDRLVVEQVRSRGVPMAVVLGGGYGDVSWQYSARFLGWILSGTEIETPDSAELTLLRFRQIKSRLDPLHLTQSSTGNGWELTEDDLVGILPGIPRQTRFLGYFSKTGIELILERFGIFEQFRARGFRAPTLQFDLDHPLGQTMRVFGDLSRKELLVELRVNRSVRAIPGFEVMLIEWLLLQNPREEFTESRPQLPGQNHPGLGMLREFFGLLVILAEELRLDGILFNPAAYHVAALSSRFVSFVEPGHEAVFRAFRDALGRMPLPEASSAVAGERVRNASTGATARWDPMPMVLPVSDRLRERYSGEAYERAVREASAELRFELRPEHG
ncbi:MAG: histone deacetylase [Acidobacteriota bacterium]